MKCQPSARRAEARHPAMAATERRREALSAVSVGRIEVRIARRGHGKRDLDDVHDELGNHGVLLLLSR